MKEKELSKVVSSGVGGDLAECVKHAVWVEAIECFARLPHELRKELRDQGGK